MRHLRGGPQLAQVEIPLLTRGVVQPARLRLLVAAPRRQDGITPRIVGARVRAVAMAVVTPAAQQEHLAAPGADDKSQRIGWNGRRVGPILYTRGGDAT